MLVNIFPEEIKTFTPDVHTDYRGELWTTWKKDEFPKNLEFNHDKVSTSRKNVIRGIHGDFKSWKLVTCLYGELYFVVVDNRKDSISYLEWDCAILNDKKKILSHITINQKDHNKFGGVVPEIASRAHLQILQTIIPQSLKEAKIKLEAGIFELIQVFINDKNKIINNY